MELFIFMIATILGFKLFPKITGITLIVYTVVMIVAQIFEQDWAWYPFT